MLVEHQRVEGQPFTTAQWHTSSSRQTELIHYMMRKRACLEDIREHGADSVLAHAVLVLTVKVVKEMDIVQWVLILHRKINAVLTQNHIFLLQTHALQLATAATLRHCLQQHPAFSTQPTYICIHWILSFFVIFQHAPADASQPKAMETVESRSG